MIPRAVKGCLVDLIDRVDTEFEQDMFNKAIRTLKISKYYPAPRNIRYKMHEEARKYEHRRYG